MLPWRGTGLRGRRRAVAIGVAVVLVAAGAAVPVLSRLGGWSPGQTQAQRSVSGRAVPDRQPPPHSDDVPYTPPDRLVWPSGSGLVDVPAKGAVAQATVDGLPLSVGRPTGTVEAAERVRVRVLDHAASTRSGVDGVVFTLTPDSATSGGALSLRLNYGEFRHAFGGDWANRLGLVRLPGCALTTPELAQCQARTPIATRNDPRAATLTADLTVEPAGAVFAAEAGASSAVGDFKATSLSPSASWQVSAQTGGFSWTYPMRTPPAPAGPAPAVELSYSSGAVDGRVASTNNQTSWVGEGFELWPGYVERHYRSCADDGVSTKPGDLCWAGEFDSVMLDGHSSDLVRAGTGNSFRLREDDGTRVEKLTGAANNDSGTDTVDGRGEYWKVTTPDGTQYFFGLNHLPGWAQGNPETHSAWTTPVFGDDSGEPCHQSTFAASSCVQAYRWNLDYVVDPHGNALTHYYQNESNKYGRNLVATDTISYDRGGYLLRTEYGLRAGALFATPPARVLFDVSERCVSSGSFTCDPSTFSKANASHWPDVPADRDCASTATSCPGLLAPTFWSRKRLTGVRTQLWNGATWRDVDAWKLDQSFPVPGDQTAPALWLKGITHVGSDRTTALPAVTFLETEVENRVDALEGIAPMDKRRIRAIFSEAGGEISVNYSEHECARASNMPASPESNTMRCFPVYWTPEGAQNPTLDWFHKYVVTSVVATDNTTAANNTPRSLPEVTSYLYSGGAAWHFDTNDTAPADRRTWSEWRGYANVSVVHGDTGTTQSQTDHLFLRGMDGDKLPGGGTRSVRVTDSQSGVVTDSPRFNGFERETTVHDGRNGPVLQGTINDPALIGPTATQSTDRKAYLLGTGAVHGRLVLSGGTWRRTEVDNSYDSLGVVTSVSDLGDTATASDDTCARYSYARNTDAWILAPVSRVETVSAACSATVSRPDQLISDNRTFYDGSTTLGAPVTKGDATRAEELSSWSGHPVYVPARRTTYDALGRPLQTLDAAGNPTTTTYTPAGGGLLTQVSTTNALGHKTTTTYDPAYGQPTGVTDPNNKHATLAYDVFGRLTKVWLPARAANLSPSMQYGYQFSTTKPIVVTTQTLRTDGTYATSYQLYDSLLRPVQTQDPAPGGGRLITDTFYDTRGLVSKSNQRYFNNLAPAVTLFAPADNQVPAQDLFSYDGSERVSVDAVRLLGVEKYRTTTTYGGDRVSVNPPAGAVATTTVTDARGRTTELRQYHNGGPTGDYDSTTYTYDRAGRLATVTDPAHNVWARSYDLRGRLSVSTDPDQGESRLTYNDLDQIVTATDAAGHALASVYDALGRRTELHETSLTGPKLASWTYDTLMKGYPTGSTRFVGTNAYSIAITGYDVGYRPTGTSLTLPAVEGALQGTYTTSTTYNLDGSVKTTTMPAAATQVGTLGPETLTFGYNELGMLTTLSSNLGTYINATTYAKLGMPLERRFGVDGQRVVRDFAYEDGTNRLSRSWTDLELSTGARQADITYGYDDAGNVTSIADVPPATNAAPDVQCFRYDYLRRLVEAFSVAATCPTTRTPEPSAVGGAAPYWQSYTYDVTGSRTGDTQHATGGDTVRTYTYPPAGGPQPHTLTGMSQQGPDGTRQDTFSYNASGQTTSRSVDAAAQVLDWDSEGHLASVTQGGDSTRYLYDADGNRMIRRDPSGTTLYLAGTELKLDNASGIVKTTRYYGDGSGTAAVRTYDGRLAWQLEDAQNTAQVSIDSSTLAVTRRRFTPFGEPRGPAEPWRGEHGFVGGTRDASTGLTHLGAREYDPTTGRFISVDPVVDMADPQQMNGYSYANDNPTTFSDPSGLLFNCGPDNVHCGGDPNYNNDGSLIATPPPAPPLGHVTPAGFSSSYGVSPRDNQEHGYIRRGSITVEVPLGGPPTGRLVDLVDWAYTEQQKRVRYILDEADLWGILVALCESSAVDCGDQFYHDVRFGLYHAQIAEGDALGNDSITPELGGVGRRPSGGEAKPARPAAEPRKTGGCSFTPDTRVLMGDGSTKPIGDVGPGDTVRAVNTQTGTTATRPVTARLVNDDRDLADVTVLGGDGAEAILHTTQNHRFWDATTGSWVEAVHLVAGHALIGGDGRQSTVRRVSTSTGRQYMYNLTVADLHDYLVLAGGTPVLVHNDCPEEGGGGTSKPSQKKVKEVPRVIRNAIEKLRNGDLTQRLDKNGNPDVYEGRDAPLAVKRMWAGSAIYDVPGLEGTEYRLLLRGDGVIGWTDNHYKAIYRYHG